MGDVAFPCSGRSSSAHFILKEAGMRTRVLKIVGVIVGVLNVALIGGGLKAW
jgi:hypothetical protein